MGKNYYHLLNKPKLNFVLVAVVVIGGFLLWCSYKSASVTLSPAVENETRALSSPSDTKNWKTYRNDEYGFSIMYPPELGVEAYVSTSGTDSTDRFVSIDIGTSEYLTSLKKAQETESPPLYLRLNASLVKEVERARLETLLTEGTCYDTAYSFSGFTDMDGTRAVTCEGMGMGGPTLTVLFSKDSNVFFVAESNVYTGQVKREIEQILSTFKFD